MKGNEKNKKIKMQLNSKLTNQKLVKYLNLASYWPVLKRFSKNEERGKILKYNIIKNKK